MEHREHGLITFIVRYECPYCKKQGEIIVTAESRTSAKSKAIGTPIICPKCLRGFILKSEYIKAVVPMKEMAVPKYVAAVAIEKAQRFPDGTVSVTLRYLRGEHSIIFPRNEVAIFDKLERIAKTAGRTRIEYPILAFLIAHEAGTKSIVTGFLRANNYDVSVSTVGEALSRLQAEGYITSEGSFLQEKVYHVPMETRLRIIERLKFDPHLEWYNLLKPTPLKAFLAKEIKYEWVKFAKPTPPFRSAEDYKRYGPYKEGEIAKLPIALAYFLVKTDYAEWLNPEKETVKKAEEIFKFQTIEKIRRQATLIEYGVPYERERKVVKRWIF